jgi:hypothetical protein
MASGGLVHRLPKVYIPRLWNLRDYLVRLASVFLLFHPPFAYVPFFNTFSFKVFFLTSDVHVILQPATWPSPTIGSGGLESAI